MCPPQMYANTQCCSYSYVYTTQYNSTMHSTYIPQLVTSVHIARYSITAQLANIMHDNMVLCNTIRILIILVDQLVLVRLLGATVRIRSSTQLCTTTITMYTRTLILVRMRQEEEASQLSDGWLLAAGCGVAVCTYILLASQLLWLLCTYGVTY